MASPESGCAETAACVDADAAGGACAKAGAAAMTTAPTAMPVASRVAIARRAGRRFIRRNVSCRGSCAVIGVAGQNRRGTVQLFEQHDTDQLMRPRRGPERQVERGSATQFGRKSVGTADQEGEGRNS